MAVVYTIWCMKVLLILIIPFAMRPWLVYLNDEDIIELILKHMDKVS